MILYKCGKLDYLSVDKANEPLMNNCNIPRQAKIVFFLITLFQNPLYAMKVQPLLVEMQSVGNRSVATINVVNDGANQLPVEVSVEQLFLDVDGKSKHEPAEDDWLIFPPQALIPPGGQQNFRLQWLGEADLDKSRSFHLAVKQVPVKMPEGQSGIQLVYNIRALVNVAPPNAESDLQVSDVTIDNIDDKQARISLLLDNPSRTHAMLSNHELSISLIDEAGKSFWSYQLSSNEIFQTIGAGLVQPGNQRRFQLPIELPDEAGNSGVKVAVSINESGF